MAQAGQDGDKDDDEHGGGPGSASEHQEESKQKPEEHQDKEQKNDEQKKDEQKKRPALWPWLLGSLVLISFVAVVLYQVYVPKPDVWTDDAYVTVHYATMAPRISGKVIDVLVEDNQVVPAGQALVAIDPRDFQASVHRAQASVARDIAHVDAAAADVARQPALIAQQEAALASAQARLDFSRTDQVRYKQLAASGAGTTQQHQQADTVLKQDRASVFNAQAALQASQQQLAVLRAQQASAEGDVEADRAQLEQAELNLSYTKIVAPIGGMIGERTVQVGNYVAPGTTLMTLIPLDRIYIEANYREQDLKHVRPGQHVTIHVDAYDVKLDGIVNSIPPASGAVFAPIAPDNATGNFTKVVQRLPVKIVLSANQPVANLLRAGLSVETTIHTGLADVVAAEGNVPDHVPSPTSR